MERHKCKLCSRSFSNGRALGGHMKGHLATLALPPKTHQIAADRTDTALSSSSSSGEEEVEEVRNAQADERGTTFVYGLRENPKKSFKLADPEFSLLVDAGSLVQDRESETESKSSPTRQRSKRGRKNEDKKLEHNKKAKLRSNLSCSESPTEPEPLSSLSNTNCSPEEDIAMCLMMLSRDIWVRKINIPEEQQTQSQNEEAFRSMDESKGLMENIKFKKVRGKHKCEKCRKTFRSSRALMGHKRVCFSNGEQEGGEGEEEEGGNAGKDKIFECPFCYRVFGSGQALGGHKRSHLVISSSSSSPIPPANKTITSSGKLISHRRIDLNLPAPAEEDEFSGVSDA